jgi:hypothetical protein
VSDNYDTNAGAGGKDIAVRLNEAGTSRRGRRWEAGRGPGRRGASTAGRVATVGH